MKTYKFIACAAVALLLTACGNPKLGYFQNVQSSQVSVLPPAQLIKAQPGDKLSILVSSKNPQLAYLYNLPIVGHYETASSLASLGNSRVASYRVDEAGDIQFAFLHQPVRFFCRIYCLVPFFRAELFLKILRVERGFRKKHLKLPEAAFFHFIIGIVPADGLVKLLPEILPGGAFYLSDLLLRLV